MPRMPTKSLKPTEADETFRKELLLFLGRHLTPDTKERYLALASHAVGQILAHQDQSRMTKEACIQIIQENIEAGNAEVIRAFMDKPVQGRG